MILFKSLAKAKFFVSRSFLCSFGIIAASLLTFNKYFDSSFNIPLSLLSLLLAVSFARFNRIAKEVVIWYSIFILSLSSITLIHLIENSTGFIPELNRFLVLNFIAILAMLFRSLDKDFRNSLVFKIYKSLLILIGCNFLFSFLQFFEVITPFSFSKSHFHGIGRISGVFRNSFIFSEPSYNTVFTLLSFLFIKESSKVAYKSTILRFIQNRVGLLSALILFSTFSISGLIGLVIVFFYYVKDRLYKRLLFIFSLSFILTIFFTKYLVDISFIKALLDRIKGVASNPSSDPRLYDFVKSFDVYFNHGFADILFGNGLGSWYFIVGRQDPNIIHLTSNNFFFDTIIELGLIGLLLLLFYKFIISSNAKIFLSILLISSFFQIHLSAAIILLLLIPRKKVI